MFLLATSISSNASTDEKVTLKLCELPPIEPKIATTTFRKAISTTVSSDVEAWSKNEDKQYFGSGMHPFITSLHFSYSYHKTFVISPDMVWLLIAQGFAKHVDQNGEALRHHFVDFQNKKSLHVNIDFFTKGSPNNDWQSVFSRFSSQIEEYTGKKLINNVVLNFSTTGPIEKAAFEVTLMDSMSSYFEFSGSTLCGVPTIILEGNTADWQKILDKSKTLSQYELKWWVDGMTPVLEQFVAASKGTVDKDFWTDIYKKKSVFSGTPKITGWINVFFPYSEYGDNIQVRKDLHEYTTTDSYTSGFSKVDFKWFYFEQEFNMEFLAGFLATEYNKANQYYRPTIGWAVRDKQKTPKERHDDERKRLMDKYKKEYEELGEQL
jgi:hypothetical protein